MEKLYTDIDYNSFPVADLAADIHWIQLPAARWAEVCRARREALHQQRLAKLPEDHRIILVPADPDYSPLETELWPLINQTVLEILAQHPDVLATVSASVQQLLAAHRGWSNPFPAPFEAPDAKPN